MNHYQTHVSCYLISAEEMEVGDRDWLKADGRLTFTKMRAALAVQYPDREFVTGQHGNQLWMRRTK